MAKRRKFPEPNVVPADMAHKVFPKSQCTGHKDEAHAALVSDHICDVRGLAGCIFLSSLLDDNRSWRYPRNS